MISDHNKMTYKEARVIMQKFGWWTERSAVKEWNWVVARDCDC